MTITMKNSAQTTATTTSLTFVYSSVPHEGHPYYNDDTILLDKRRGLAAVFDGVGSGPGQLASRTAARVIRRLWNRMHAQPELLGLPTALDLELLLPQMFEEAHQQILLEGARRIKGLPYPATTAALTLFCQLEDDHGYRMYYAHVGDSRIYLWRPGETLRRLTDDDGFLSLRVLDGSVTAEDALRIDQAEMDEELNDVERGYFDNRNGITQALGHDKPLETHLGQVDILPGDRVLICSDGIHDNLTDKILAQLLETASRTGVAKKITRQAIDQSHQISSSQIRSKSDDMSAIVITSNTSR